MSATSYEIKCDKVEAAIERYHLALDQRQHGDVAAGVFISEVREIMGKYWEPGEALKRAKKAARKK